MTDLGALRITVNIDFPNGDRTAVPVVTNSCAEDDTVASGYSAVEWFVNCNLPLDNEENLTLTGVTFYTDATKRTPYNPPCFNMPGSNNGRLAWAIGFSDQAVDQDTPLTYVLTFKDDLFNNLRWDPTLTIQKRNATAGAG
ncbi:MAG: hypothetical protein DRQ55_07195 [Planctomycetota bacterium]|nr:MAG: hypothetical protein DRQ55_07195 [Planctomycetota bacterium]